MSVPCFRTVASRSCLKYRCCSVFLDSCEAYLSQKSVPFRDFGQLQTVVMLSGLEYDLRQGGSEVRHPTAGMGLHAGAAQRLDGEPRRLTIRFGCGVGPNRLPSRGMDPCADGAGSGGPDTRPRPQQADTPTSATAHQTLNQ